VDDRVPDSPLNEPDLGVRPGDVLAGKYRVDSFIGAGGMGVVARGYHLQLDEPIALKFLRGSILENPEAVARFVREARAVVKIKSNHVARVMDVGQLDNGAPYMVMELLEGSDLAHRIQETGPFDVNVAVDYVLQACEALAEAHARGIVHRDLKPANLFCVPRHDGRITVKVLDFGISKVAGGSPDLAGMTGATMMLGTPAYMSPEQIMSSRDVDVRTDVWSLGVILFELLTGRVPVEAVSIPELIVRVSTQPAPPIRTIRPDVSAELERVIATCLQQDPSRRFPSIGALVAALEPLRGTHASRAMPDLVQGTLVSGGPVTRQQPLVLPESASPVAQAQSASRSQPEGAAMQETAAPWSDSGAHARPASRRLAPWVLGACSGLVLAGIAAAFVSTRTVAPTTSAAAGAVAVGVEAPTAPTSPEVSPTAPPTGGVPLAASASASAVPSPMTPESASRSPHPAPSSTSRGPAQARGACDPPYTYDAKGTRHYKPECL
jgi:serine/threonine-protein kinase